MSPSPAILVLAFEGNSHRRNALRSVFAGFIRRIAVVNDARLNIWLKRNVKRVGFLAERLRIPPPFFNFSRAADSASNSFRASVRNLAARFWRSIKVMFS